MLDWDNNLIDMEQGNDFVNVTEDHMRNHEWEVKYCMLNDPDCEACQ